MVQLFRLKRKNYRETVVISRQRFRISIEIPNLIEICVHFGDRRKAGKYILWCENSRHVTWNPSLTREPYAVQSRTNISKRAARGLKLPNLPAERIRQGVSLGLPAVWNHPVLSGTVPSKLMRIEPRADGGMTAEMDGLCGLIPQYGIEGLNRLQSTYHFNDFTKCCTSYWQLSVVIATIDL